MNVKVNQEEKYRTEKSLHIHIIHKIFSLGNPFGRKPSWKVRPLRSLSLSGNMVAGTKK